MPADQLSLELTFEQVDEIVGGLPASARVHRPWWANSSHSHALAWRNVGWHVAEVEMAGRRVRFARGRVGGTRADLIAGQPPQQSEVATPSTAQADISAPGTAGAGSLPEPVGEVAVTVRFAWTRLGVLRLDGAQKVAFPQPLPDTPGLYRMSFDGAERWYIGESDNLRRRLGSNYRNPGPRQRTSLRVNDALRNHLGAGGAVTLDIAVAAQLIGPEITVESLDLTRKAGRLLAESAALVLAQLAGHKLENLG